MPTMAADVGSNSTSSLPDVNFISKRPRRYSPQCHTSCGLNDDFGIHVVREKLLLDLRSEVHNMRAAFLAPPPPTPTPWNLRTRPSFFGGDEPAPAPRARFSVALTREEVVEDFVAMLGRRPPRKPKKRPRYIHKELETIFPGVWLSEVTADMYKVNESAEAPK